MTAPLKVGVVGVGHLGKEHARIYRDLPEAELVGISDMDPAKEDKAKELEALDQQIITLINRYYDLVAPTEEELGAAGENLWDDRREACELLTDSNAPLGKWYLAGDTLAYREMMAEEEKTGQGES